MVSPALFPLSLYNILDFELFILLILFCVCNYLFYRVFLKNVSDERHESITRHFKSLIKYLCILSVLFTAFSLSSNYASEALHFKKITVYLAGLTFFIGSVIFVKCFRLFVLQYLFLGSMRTGVPLLLVNIFSLILSILILFWSLSKVFGIDLTPILATSAAFYFSELSSSEAVNCSIIEITNDTLRLEFLPQQEQFIVQLKRFIKSKASLL